MTGAEPREEYDARLSRLAVAAAEGDRRHLVISNLRLAIFAIAALVAWLAFARALISPVWLLVPALAFAALLVAHARVLNANDRVLRARRYYERGVSRLQGTWAGAGPDGARFIGDHHYARDLDLFGPGSLFQLIDTARTEAGEQTLADWLSTPAGRVEVIERQAAVAELRDRLDFRETLAVLSAEAHVSRTGALTNWAAAAPVGLGPAHAVLFASCAALTAALVSAMFAGWISSPVVLAWLTVPAAIALVYKRRVWQVIRRVDAAADDLSLLEALLGRLEVEVFHAARLATLRGALEGQARPSVLIARLRRSIAARDALRNEFVRPFGLLLLVRSQAAVAIDRWHQNHRAALAGWIAAIGEFEALASLATSSYRTSARSFPTIEAGGPVFDAVALGHPLLPDASAIRNDVSLGGQAPRVLIISGSNMSGKSTLLRAVGTNAVLALAGGPVRAERLVLSPGDRCHHTRRGFTAAGALPLLQRDTQIRDIVQLTGEGGQTPGQTPGSDPLSCFCWMRSSTGPIRTIAGSAQRQWSGLSWTPARSVW